MNARTEALRLLEEETREARELFEAEAQRQPAIWAAYERWRAGGDQAMLAVLNSDHALRKLWSAYIHLEVRFHSAALLPNWPFSAGTGDLTPPGGKRTP